MTRLRLFLESLFLKMRVFLRIRRTTPLTKIEELIRKLHPVEIDLPLIRVGSKYDGGYLLPDDLHQIDYVFSPGVGNKQDFDEELVVLGKKVILADASVEKPINLETCAFDKKYIGAVTCGEYISLTEWIKSHTGGNDSHDLLLQMDIEGYEYAAILSCHEEILKRFRTIIIEFHDLDQLFCNSSHKLIDETFRKLLIHHDVVHIHPNNCSVPVVSGGISVPPVMEFTFHRKDAHRIVGHVKRLPHPLDSDCTLGRSVNLPECWYGNDR